VTQVAVLKNRIQEAKGMPADSLKIVYKGKTVTNEDTIEKLGIKETDFLVVMAQVQVCLKSRRNLSLNQRKKQNQSLPNRKKRWKLKLLSQKLPSQLQLPTSPASLRPILMNSCRWDSPETNALRL
jgi:hypothetical protein